MGYFTLLWKSCQPVSVYLIAEAPSASEYDTKFQTVGEPRVELDRILSRGAVQLVLIVGESKNI